jgi:hypothetical protein
MDDPVLLVHWEKTLGDLLDRTLKFPKAVRFTFSSRIDNLALDIIENLTLARYAPPARQRALLAEVDGSLARLRVLVRLSYERRYLGRRGFEHVVRNLDEAGRMVGGWRRALGRG